MDQDREPELRSGPQLEDSILQTTWMVEHAGALEAQSPFCTTWSRALQHPMHLSAASASLLAQILEQLTQGHSLAKMEPQGPMDQDLEPLVASMPYGMALKSLHQAERKIAQLWTQLSQQNPRLPLVVEQAASLSPEQQQAVEAALTQSAFLLEGGPGTGKTYTAAAILHQINAAGHRWMALAPTGKAKAQLQASLQRAGLPAHSVLTVQAALHRRSHDCPKLPVDMLLVDEGSMLDIPLFYSLLQAVPQGARLLVMGDRYQLQPVGPGQPFADLCAALQGSRQHLRLTQSQRVEQPLLHTLAEYVQQGSPALLDLLTLLPWGSPRDLMTETVQFHSRRLPEDPDELLLALKQRMVLNALQEGPHGTEAIHAHLLEHAVDPRHPWRPMPLLITRNAERMELWNGDLGWLCRPKGEEPFALLPMRETEAFRKSSTTRAIPLSLLPSWSPAWMLTIHKAQGSEFDHVMAVLPPGSETFGRPLLYTAVTRARRGLSVRAQPDLLTSMLANTGQRRTSLPYWLPRQAESGIHSPQ